MTERPILFSSPMVRAILAGTKTQTRRVVKPQPAEVNESGRWYRMPSGGLSLNCYTCPYGEPGARLWGRETWAVDAPLDQVRREREDVLASMGHGPYYRADGVHEDSGLTWRPSIHMPRWASRITLEVTAVRVERVQEISDADARAEGAPIGEWFKDDLDGGRLVKGDHRLGFRVLWNTINGKRPGCAWADNPYVWAISFRRIVS